jgi:Insect cuticle protein
MAFKFVLFCAAIAVASAGVIPAYEQSYYQPSHSYVQPAAHAIVKQVVHEAPANYDFNYEVHDTHTGDIKRQHETAKDGVISGQYSLYDADGYHRVVEYTADDHNGFQANVRREPTGHAQQAVKVIAQPAIAVQKVIAAPAVHYSAPVHSYQHAAPVVSYQHAAPSHSYQHSAPSYSSYHH